MWRWRKALLVLGVFVVLLLTSTSYLVGFFTVDGVSMFPTLQDRSVHALVKFPRTMDRINGSE